jgi:hypothetical protein
MVGYLMAPEGMCRKNFRAALRPGRGHLFPGQDDSWQNLCHASLWLPDVLFDMGVLVGMDAFGGGVTGRFGVDCE